MAVDIVTKHHKGWRIRVRYKHRFVKTLRGGRKVNRTRDKVHSCLKPTRKQAEAWCRDKVKRIEAADNLEFLDASEPEYVEYTQDYIAF